jgi:hypothetical protein
VANRQRNNAVLTIEMSSSIARPRTLPYRNKVWRSTAQAKTVVSGDITLSVGVSQFSPIVITSEKAVTDS